MPREAGLAAPSGSRSRGSTVGVVAIRMILSVWLLLSITSPISAHISTYAYASEQACEAHAQGAQRCVEFRSPPLDQLAPPPPPDPRALPYSDGQTAR